MTNPKSEFEKFGTETAIEIIKQLITISSGFIVITGSIIAALLRFSPVVEVFWLAILAWAASIVSIGAGILALGDIVTTTQDKKKFNVDEPYTRKCMQYQQVAFVVSFALFVIFVSFNIIDSGIV